MEEQGCSSAPINLSEWLAQRVDILFPPLAEDGEYKVLIVSLFAYEAAKIVEALAKRYRRIGVWYIARAVSEEHVKTHLEQAGQQSHATVSVHVVDCQVDAPLDMDTVLKDVQTERFDCGVVTIFGLGALGSDETERVVEGMWTKCQHTFLPLLEELYDDHDDRGRESSTLESAKEIAQAAEPDKLNLMHRKRFFMPHVLSEFLQQTGIPFGSDRLITYANLQDIEPADRQDVHVVSCLLGIDLSVLGFDTVDHVLSHIVQYIGKSSRVLEQVLRVFCIRRDGFRGPPKVSEVHHLEEASAQGASASSGAWQNVGYEKWCKSRAAWTSTSSNGAATNSSTHATSDAPVNYADLVENLASLKRTYTFPQPVKLADVVEVLVDIWEAQDGY